MPSSLSIVAALAATASAAHLPARQASGQSCSQLGNNSQVGPYTIRCGVDRLGGDISNAWSDSFSGCIPQCDAITNCVGFTYVASSRFCYFKGELTSESFNSNVDVAVRPAGRPTTSSTSSVPSTTPAVPFPTTTASATTPSAPAATGSCESIGSGNTVGPYSVTCNQDAPGGDLSNAQAPTFQACIPLCDNLAGCIGFAYFQGFCYFKDNRSPSQAAPGVSIAFRLAPNIPAPSTTLTTTRASTTAQTTAQTTATQAPTTTSSTAQATPTGNEGTCFRLRAQTTRSPVNGRYLESRQNLHAYWRPTRERGSVFSIDTAGGLRNANTGFYAARNTVAHRDFAYVEFNAPGRTTNNLPLRNCRLGNGALQCGNAGQSFYSSGYYLLHGANVNNHDFPLVAVAEIVDCPPEWWREE